MYSIEIKKVFEENYEWFKRYLRGRFFSLNDYDAEDIIQHTALNLIRRGENIAGIKNLTSYVYSALENGTKDLWRKRRKETLVPDREEEGSEGLEDAVLAAELKSVITASVRDLDEKHRYVFVETVIKGRSYEELALETGEKLGTLLSRKSRAMKKIKADIYNYLDQEEEK